MRRTTQLALGLGAATVALAAALVANTLRAASVQPHVAAVTEAVDVAAVSQALAEVVRVETVDRDGQPPSPESLAALHAALAARFPRVHAELLLERVAEHTLIFTWTGSDPALPAGILLAHQDVVPASGEGWSVPPFEGRVADGFVWGRGTLDDKMNLVGELTAVETLLGRGFRPRRTVHLVFGHDEELIGHGAEAAAARLGGPFAWVLDEGGVVLADVMPGLDAPVALVGVAEKGYLTVDLVARGEGGHSSMPPSSSAAGTVAAAVVRLEDHPLAARLSGPTGAMFDAVGPEMAFPMRLVLANRWLTAPLLTAVLAAKPSTNATVRTTTAVTMLSGSDKENVLPREATATVNFRLVPGDTVDEVLAHVRGVVGPDIEVRPHGSGNDASPVSRADGPAWDALATAIRETFPDAVVAPFLFVGATDAGRFAPKCDATYRFSPIRFADADLDRLHGVDERIAVDALGPLVSFYVRFLQHAAGT